MAKIRLINLFIFSFLAFFLNTNLLLAAEDTDDEFNAGEMINHHILDSHEWEFWEGVTLYLPVIIYSPDRGVEIFSSRYFSSHGGHDTGHSSAEYKGYKYEHGTIIPVDENRSVIDFSITKNVVMLFLNALVMILIFFAVARGYSKNKDSAPKGIQSLFEPIIIFVRDEVVKPNIGPKYEKYLPYMLTLFFFIWFGNLLGLFPGAANLTGNVAVTITLAFFTFLITNLSGNKQYWVHIFNTPGVPWWLKFPLPVMPMVEFIGIFTKPFSLLLRLFVAITAGHIVILSLLSLIFIFQSYAVGIGSTILVLFINIIEILVATIQAYVFTMFSSLYIGLAIEEEH